MIRIQIIPFVLLAAVAARADSPANPPPKPPVQRMSIDNVPDRAALKKGWECTLRDNDSGFAQAWVTHPAVVGSCAVPNRCIENVVCTNAKTQESFEGEANCGVNSDGKTCPLPKDCAAETYEDPLKGATLKWVPSKLAMPDDPGGGDGAGNANPNSNH